MLVSQHSQNGGGVAVDFTLWQHLVLWDCLTDIAGRFNPDWNLTSRHQGLIEFPHLRRHHSHSAVIELYACMAQQHSYLLAFGLQIKID